MGLRISDVVVAAEIIARGGVVAYPTEACFGIGCDPTQHAAVARILSIKNRPSSMGMILIADRFERLTPYLDTSEPSIFQDPLSTWPGPHTWVLPANRKGGRLLVAKDNSIAVRITDHPTAAMLCRLCRHPIVSTSANRHGTPPARKSEQVTSRMGEQLDYIVRGPVGGLKNPTRIQNAITGQLLRSS